MYINLFAIFYLTEIASGLFFNHNLASKKIIKKITSSIIVPLLFTSTFHPSSSNAGLFSSEDQALVEKISSFRKQVDSLHSQLKITKVPNAIGVYIDQQVNQ
jgi:hypothetical protein